MVLITVHCPSTFLVQSIMEEKKSTNIQGDVNQEKYGQSKYLIKVCKVANIICGN